MHKSRRTARCALERRLAARVRLSAGSSCVLAARGCAPRGRLRCVRRRGMRKGCCGAGFERGLRAARARGAHAVVNVGPTCTRVAAPSCIGGARALDDPFSAPAHRGVTGCPRAVLHGWAIGLREGAARWQGRASPGCCEKLVGLGLDALVELAPRVGLWHRVIEYMQRSGFFGSGIGPSAQP